MPVWEYVLWVPSFRGWEGSFYHPESYLKRNRNEGYISESTLPSTRQWSKVCKGNCPSKKPGLKCIIPWNLLVQPVAVSWWVTWNRHISTIGFLTNSLLFGVLVLFKTCYSGICLEGQVIMKNTTNLICNFPLLLKEGETEVQWTSPASLALVFHP